MTAAHQLLPACQVIPFPRAYARSMTRPPAGMWIDEPTAVDVEKRLEDYGLIVSRAWDVSAIAATIGAMTACGPEDCAAAALAVSQQILANIKVPL